MTTITLRVYMTDLFDGHYSDGSAEINLEVPMSLVNDINFDASVKKLIDEAQDEMKDKLARQAQRIMEMKAFDAESKTS